MDQRSSDLLQSRRASFMLTLRNPHSVLAAIERRPRDVAEIRLTRSQPQDAWQRVVEAAAANGIAVHVQRGGGPGRRVPRGEEGGRSPSAEALVRDLPPTDLRDLFQRPASPASGDTPSPPTRLWLALDQVQDPHNLGAVFRSAAFFGVQGIVLTRHHSAPMTGTVYDVASGGAESVPYALEANLHRALTLAKEAGLWVLGTSEHASQSLWDIPRDRDWLVVVGNEETGMRRLTTETCDEVCTIAARGAIGSLNVSVATGALLSALSRPASAG
ncbi:MAG: RNA methyltransferase [Planctomycetaceae bacterium]